MEAAGVLCYHYPLFLPAFGMAAASSFSLISIIIIYVTNPPARLRWRVCLLNRGLFCGWWSGEQCVPFFVVGDQVGGV